MSISERIARAFNRSGATRAVALDISKAFDSVWNAGLLHKLKFYGISGQIFGLISSFLRNIRLQVVLDGVSCTIAIYADDITLCSKCDQASDLWQQGVWTGFRLESDLQNTKKRGRKWLVWFNAGKTSWFRFSGLITLKLLM